RQPRLNIARPAQCSTGQDEFLIPFEGEICQSGQCDRDVLGLRSENLIVDEGAGSLHPTCVSGPPDWDAHLNSFSR
ncbi:MAG TPA: hypothetical protein PKK82_06695, partial [Anaerolineaceae bacterium]|nr:hypothetical protein [Anaerolineaceae bacterium]